MISRLYSLRFTPKQIVFFDNSRFRSSGNLEFNYIFGETNVFWAKNDGVSISIYDHEDQNYAKNNQGHYILHIELISLKKACKKKSNVLTCSSSLSADASRFPRRFSDLKLQS